MTPLRARSTRRSTKLLQLAHVARPVVADQVRAAPRARAVGTGSEWRVAVVRDEVVEQLRHVLAAVAQRGHRQVDDVEPVVEVLAEVLRRDPVGEVAVGGGDHAHVDARLRALGADALDLAALEEAQQQRLHPQAHLPHFVHEDRAAVRRLEQARLVAVGAGERAAHVAEQLRLEERVGQAGAVDRDELRARAGALLVDQAGEDLLADAALAGDEDLRVRPGRVLQLLAEFADRRASPDELFAVFVHRCRSCQQPPIPTPIQPIGRK